MKKFILLLIIIVVLGLVIFQLPGILLSFKKFNELGNITTRETPYKLEKSQLAAYNIRTGQKDTLQFRDPLIINFWATWCKPCLEEMSSLHRLAAELKDIPVILVTFDTLALKPGLPDRLGLSLPIFYLEDSSIFKKPELLPTTFLIKNDSVHKIYYAAMDWAESGTAHEIRNYLK